MKKELEHPSAMTTRTLVPFLVLVFSLTWGIAAILILFPDQAMALFGELDQANPLFILAVYSPGLVGVFLVWRSYGMAGLTSFVRRLTLWRAPRAWWWFLIVGIPIIVYTAAAISGSIKDPLPYSSWAQWAPVLLLAFFLGPVEELGWRGVALPLLQRAVAPLWAGVILGLVHAVWHIPAFLLSGTPQSAWSFAPYFAGVIAINVILTPLFNASRGSLLIAYLYHFQLMNPVFPDAQPWDNLIYIIAAVIIVWLNRSTMLTRGNGVTDVLMPQRGR